MGRETAMSALDKLSYGINVARDAKHLSQYLGIKNKTKWSHKKNNDGHMTTSDTESPP